MGNQLSSSITKGLDGTKRQVTLSKSVLYALMHELNLLFPEAKTFAKTDHFIILLEHKKPKTSEVILTASVCDCTDGNGACYDARA